MASNTTGEGDLLIPRTTTFGVFTLFLGRWPGPSPPTGC